MDDLRWHQEPETPEQQAHAARMHDLRSPLTVLVGRVQLLRRHLQGCDYRVRVHDDLEAIEAALAPDRRRGALGSIRLTTADTLTGYDDDRQPWVSLRRTKESGRRSDPSPGLSWAPESFETGS